MKLLELDGGKASLELARDEVQVALHRLGRAGRVKIEPRTTYDLVRVAGHDFVYLDEWDEPCLISADAVGTSLLAAVIADEGRALAAGV